MKPYTDNRGSANGLARLKEDEVRLIRKRIAAGEYCKDIANTYRVSPSTIFAIKRGATWGHLDAPEGAT